MVVSTTYDQLSAELQKALETYNQEIVEGMNGAYKELADAGVAKLQTTKPYHDRTGKYSAGFAVSQRKNAVTATGAESFTIHNKKHYQITHLLEHGHLTRSGSRTRAFEHWKPTLEELDRKAETIVKRVVESANNG